MAQDLEHPGHDREPLAGHRGEWIAFLTLAVLIWPFIAVAVVGDFGFLVWMLQLLTGPPGPPG